MTKAYQKVQAEILNAYDTAQAKRETVEITVSGQIVKVSHGSGIAPFFIDAFGSLTLWEVCNLLSNRTV
jgi:hypothetical protein